MIKFTILKPQLFKIGAETSFSFFTGINIYWGFGVLGAAIGCMGYGACLEFITQKN